MFSGALRVQPEPLKHNGVPPVTTPAVIMGKYQVSKETTVSNIEFLSSIALFSLQRKGIERI